jgi:hypothetical protein
MNTNTTSHVEPKNLSDFTARSNVRNLDEFPLAQSVAERKRARVGSLISENTGMSAPPPVSFADAVRAGPPPGNSRPLAPNGGSSNFWFSVDEFRNKAWWKIPKLEDIFRISVGKASRLFKSIDVQENIILKMKIAIEKNDFPKDWKCMDNFQMIEDLPIKDKFFSEFNVLKSEFFCNFAKLKIRAAESSISLLKSWYKDPEIVFQVVFEKIKAEFPGFFNFSSENLNKQFQLRLVECQKDFVKLCFERIFPKFLPSNSSVSESALDREIISTLQKNLRKVKDDEKMVVIKDVPAKDLVDGWGNKVSKDVSDLKKVVNDLKVKVSKFNKVPLRPNKGQAVTNNNSFRSRSNGPAKSFNKSRGSDITSNKFQTKSPFVSLRVDWRGKAEFAKADLSTATIKSNNRVIKFNPRIPIKDRDATVKIGRFLFWRNGNLVKNRSTFFSRKGVSKNERASESKN